MSDRRNLYFFYEKQDQTLLERMKSIYNALENNGFSILDHPKDANAIISVGGDGAFLQALRKTGFREDCLYAGISVMDETSFYCDFHINHFEKAIEEHTF